MRSHFTSYPVVKTVSVCIYILLCGCKNENSEVFTVSPSQFETYEDTVLEICGEGIKPMIKRNWGCGESTYDTSEDFRVEVRKIFNRTDDTWIRLPNVKWNWETQCLESHLLKRFIRTKLTREMHSMRVYTPDGNEYFQRYAFGVLTPQDTNPGDGSDSDNNEDSDSSGISISTDTRTDTDTDTESAIADTGPPTDDTDVSAVAPVYRTTIAWKPTDSINIDGKFTDWPTSDGIALPNSLRRIILSQANASPDESDGSYCTFEQMWNLQNLYIGIRCDDGTPQTPTLKTLAHGDSIEIYISADNRQSNTGVHKPVQIRIACVDGNQATVPWDSTVPLPGMRFRQTDIEVFDRPGFSMEIAIPWSDLNVVQPGDGVSIGYDIGFNDRDRDNDSSRDYKLMWSGTTGNYTASDDLGTLLLTNDYAPELTYTELVEASKNECSNLRDVTWNIAAIYGSPVHLISWSYYQTLSNTGCTPGDADVWFNVAVPAYSRVRFDAFNNRDFNVAFINNISDDCAYRSCRAIRNFDGTVSIDNNTPEESSATVVISAENTEIDDISYITFEATNINR